MRCARTGEEPIALAAGEPRDGRAPGCRRGGWAVEHVRPGAAGLLIGIECFRVRDSSWMYLTSFVTT